MDGEIPEWARNCPSGKVKWVSAADARKALRQENGRASKGFKGTIHVYWCPLCTSFHTTSTRSRKGR
jgi:hypothetical protein